MKTLTMFALMGSALILAGCKKQKETIGAKSAETKQIEPQKKVEPERHKELYGIYTGNFIGLETVQEPFSPDIYETDVYKRLSIKINRITKDSVYGQSVVNGNQRPFRGVFNENSKSFVLDEPGDDKTDGRFEVNIQGDSLVGIWSAFKKSAVKAPTKKVKLIRKNFVYNPNLMLDENSELVDWTNPKKFVEKYVDPDTKETELYTVEKNRVASDAVFRLNASKQKLTENQLKNLRKLDLQIIKNSVFARHGYSFKKETFRAFFESTEWYVPVSDNVDNDLTPLEKENVALLNRFIKYAEDHYDTFGR